MASKPTSPECDCDLDLLAHDERATHAYGCPATRAEQAAQDYREFEAEQYEAWKANQ